MKIFGYEIGKENPKKGYDYFGISPVINKHCIKEPIFINIKEINDVISKITVIISSGDIFKHHHHVSMVKERLIKRGMLEQKSELEIKERGVEKTIYMESKDCEASMHFYEENIPCQKTGYTFNLLLNISKK